MAKQKQLKIGQTVEGRTGRRHGAMHVLQIIKLSDDKTMATVKMESGRTRWVALGRLRATDKKFNLRPRPVPGEVDKPSRRTVEQLLLSMTRGSRSYFGDGDDPLYAAYDTINKQANQLQERLERRFVEGNPQLKKLKKKASQLYSRYDSVRTELREKALYVRRLYLANGITPRVRKLLNELVELSK